MKHKLRVFLLSYSRAHRKCMNIYSSRDSTRHEIRHQTFAPSTRDAPKRTFLLPKARKRKEPNRTASYVCWRVSWRISHTPRCSRRAEHHVSCVVGQSCHRECSKRAAFIVPLSSERSEKE